METKSELEGPGGGIKPKVEPGEEQEHSPTLQPPAFDDDWEVTPLTGDNPFFTTIISKTHVQRFLLTIPGRVQCHLPETRVPATLVCRGRSWPASYCGDLKVKKIDVAAWKDFAVDNGLRVGDACVIELITPAAEAVTEGDGKVVEFRVQVLRGGLPEEITSKGATSDEPLVIVD
ncbi:hypothetical protein HU200_004190 [Digitaria exilis]|uniref:TF-B3 domain-containing protein n=1 Tax=Digitaria exilis TaxID=1010633 RepID=A0A835FSQ6_9POAL|nr:hypothetical protein HU200_004190 [Digitaria exilis]CAB3469219.1 unnamed protein product [Digitaria exilis]